MDIKHKQAFAKLKINGVSQVVVINDGLCLIQLTQRLLSELAKAPNKYLGFEFSVQFQPVLEIETQSSQFMKDFLASGIPIEMASPEDELLYAKGNPSDPKSPIFDSLYAEWVACASQTHRDRKTPEELTQLRRHVETRYSGTQWWNGSHKW